MNIYERIYQQVRKVPYAKVTSYKQIAENSGLHRGAQIVGWALRTLPEGSDIPWHRVVNSKGLISIINPKVTKNEQKNRLEAEGVKVYEEDSYWKINFSDWWLDDQK